MNEKKRKDRNKLTEGIADSDNQSGSNRPASQHDPRIVAVVQFLARRAAERDFKKLIEESRRNPSGDDEGRIQ